MKKEIKKLFKDRADLQDNLSQLYTMKSKNDEMDQDILNSVKNYENALKVVESELIVLLTKFFNKKSKK